MQFGNGTVEASQVLRTMFLVLIISALIDIGSGYMGWRIPWSSTIAVLTLFMYACESSSNFKDRAAFKEWHDEINRRV